MAAVTNVNGAVVAGNGLGPKTFVYAIATGTITTAAAIDAMTTTYNMTIAGVEGTGDGEHVIAQGDGGAEAVSGISLVATFDQNPA